ncbi:MAG: alcohol dehydrogenase catalytic domain-containing protein, partial [Gammaproteobacteria bacterium]|nr:alcohol dehydrogenase catalytic domain-containing protein [Gammaproteobacteria bacterium]
MRAVVCESFDSPENLTVTEVEKPEPGDNQVLVRIESTGLGYVDALTVAGLYQIKPNLPFVPGNELSGVIEQIGNNVKHLRIGQRILASANGGLAEYTVVDE